METPNQLIQLIGKGNWNAFNRLFDLWFERLYLYAVSIVKERGAAEDIVQDIFLKLWEQRNRHSCEPESRVEGYLIHAVRNAAFDWLDHRKVERNYATKYRETNEDSDDISENYREALQQVMHAVEELPDDCREIFILGCIEGLSYAQIAERKGISINTVKTQIKIGYRKVRTTVGNKPLIVITLTILSKNLLK